MSESRYLGQPSGDVPTKPPGEECNGRRTERRDGEPVFVGYCKNRAGKGTDHVGEGRCKFHGGASTGPKDTGFLEGNDFAEDNPSGGAPELNTNAVVSGAWCDLGAVEQRLDDAQQAELDRWTEHYVSRADDPVTDDTREKAREAALLDVLEWRAMADAFKRGIGWTETVEIDGEEYEGERINPSLGRDVDLSRRKRNLLKEIGYYPVRPA